MHQTARLLRLCVTWLMALTLVVSSLVAHALTVTADATAPPSLPVASQFVFPVGNPFIAPTYVAGNANGFTITQGFNTSCDPNLGQGHYYGGYYFCGHSGVDLGDNGYGDVVRSVATGQVVFAGADGSFGNMVRIEHLLPDGHIVYSQYEHLGYNTVGVWYGEIVAAGQQIGAVGDSGFTQGPHLHFEMKDSNEDGPGYSFGNAALLAGYYDPIAFVLAHMPAPAPTPTPVAPVVSTPVAVSLPRLQPVLLPTKQHQGNNREDAAIVSSFLHHYRYFVTVDTPALRLRAGPGLHDRQVGVVTKRTKLALLGVKGNWLHVALPEHVSGWVYRTLVLGTIPPVMQPHPRQPAAARRVDIHRLGPLARVLTDGVRVRQGPDLQHDVLFQANHGSIVAVRGADGQWVRVTLTNGVTGWMMKEFLAMPPPKHVATQAPKHMATQAAGRASRAERVDIHTLGPLARVLADGVRVRQGPRLRDDVSFLAYHGSMVAVREIHVSWARVTFTNGATGWILRHYLLMPGERRPRHTHPSPATAKALAQPTPASAKPALYFTWATTLYVRAAPRLSGAVVAMAGENTPVVLLGTHVSWSHVRLPSGVEGWALSHYVKDHRKIYLIQ